MQENIKTECSNCAYFNGEQGDGYQFCDEKEIEVSEKSCCHRHKFKVYLEE